MLIMLSYQCCLIMVLLSSVIIKNVNESLNMERLWKISCEQPLWKYTRSAWCWQHHVTRNRWYPHFYSEKHVQYLGNCTCLPAQFAALCACFGSVSSFTSSQPVSCLVMFTENDCSMTLSITWKLSGTFILHLCGVLWHYCTGNVGHYKEILKWSQQPLNASTVTGWCYLVYQFTFKMFLHDVTLHGLTLAQMCGCTQVRLAKLQAAAESSAHKHRRDSLAKAGEGHRGAVCKQLS